MHYSICTERWGDLPRRHSCVQTGRRGGCGSEAARSLTDRLREGFTCDEGNTTEALQSKDQRAYPDLPRRRDYYG